MAVSLNVVALISGGKDSLYSILHCLHHGHNVVALANLYPGLPDRPPDEGDAPPPVDGPGDPGDLNSFMYQTVGHEVIPLYAQCLDRPLYRRVISGSARQTGRYYDTSASDAILRDETEDLVPLLREIKQAHPEVNALCCGAILSTYQRTRVESVAVRLGLVPLAYLWQYSALPPPSARPDTASGLLDDMAAAGCDARIIKIASGGIKDSLLWARLSDTRNRSRLVQGLRPFFPTNEFWLRAAVLGEGGEYETLAIDGPRTLWKMKIQVSDSHNEVVTGDGGVSYVRLAHARVTAKDAGSAHESDQPLNIPARFDRRFVAVLDCLGKTPFHDTRHVPPPRGDGIGPEGGATSALHPAWHLTSRHLSIADLTTSVSNASDPLGDAASQMKLICRHFGEGLDSMVRTHDLPLTLDSSHVVAAVLLLKDMSQFATVNAVYSSLFPTGLPNPPARVTLACHLPAGIEVCLSVILSLAAREERRGLHVQSRSYWAPANIGPYSQAICDPLQVPPGANPNPHDAKLVEMVHVAGQIPLDPSSMELLDAPFVEQTVLALQHLWRIGQEREVDVWPWGIAFLKPDTSGRQRATQAWRTWQLVHQVETGSREDGAQEDAAEEDSSFDVWNRQYNRSSHLGTGSPTSTPAAHLHRLPNISLHQGREYVPPFIAGEVRSLPRDASVEWWSLGIARLARLGVASAARITTQRKSYGWGTIDLLSVWPSTTGPSPSSAVAHFATILVQAETDLTDGEMSIATITSELVAPRDRDNASSRSAATSPEVVHGTALVPTEGQPHWSRLRELPFFAKLTVVPCTTVYGRPSLDAASDDPTRSSGETSEGAVTSVSSNATLDHHHHHHHNNNNNAPCQPLLVAITVRIDQKTSTWPPRLDE